MLCYALVKIKEGGGHDAVLLVRPQCRRSECFCSCTSIVVETCMLLGERQSIIRSQMASSCRLWGDRICRAKSVAARRLASRVWDRSRRTWLIQATGWVAGLVRRFDANSGRSWLGFNAMRGAEARDRVRRLESAGGIVRDLGDAGGGYDTLVDNGQSLGDSWGMKRNSDGDGVHDGGLNRASASDNGRDGSGGRKLGSMGDWGGERRLRTWNLRSWSWVDDDVPCDYGRIV
jgi:hypothetical protein